MTKRVIDKYLKNHIVQNEEQLTFEQKSSVFTAALKDYYSQGITIYELSEIGGMLYSTLTQAEKSTTVGEQMHWADELAFHLHHQNETDAQGTTVPNISGRILDELWKFYSNHKPTGSLKPEHSS